MPNFVRRSPMPVSAAEAFAWHARPAAFQRFQPPWEDVRVERADGAFGDGQRVHMTIGLFGPLRASWVAELFDVVPDQQFRDRQVRGPFAAWTHTHTFEPAGPDASVLEDRVEYRAPFGWIGRVTDATLGISARRLAAMFAYRHQVVASDLRRHARFRERARWTVAITGSRGLVGRELCHFLTTGGHRVVRLVRGHTPQVTFDDGTTSRPWNPDADLDPANLDGVDAVVHLAGEPIAAGRWSARRKTIICESRVGPTRRLAAAAGQAGVKVLVSASAVGIYGDRADELLDESAPQGSGFLSDVCAAWEAATEPATVAGVRVVHPRIGMVLTPTGGALAKQLPAWRFGQGAVIGHGRQWVPWISVNDLVGALQHLMMTDSLSGPVNCVAPEPVTNRVFGRTLARVVGRPFLLTAPAPALRLLLGEMADALLLVSCRAVPTRLTASGFEFDHPTLDASLRSLLGCR